jgi:hypothetical protein
LREENIDGPQNSHPEAPEAAIARIRPVGNASVHYSDSGAALVREPQKIGPELSFRNHDQLRPQSSQVRPDGKLEIKRKIKDAISTKTGAR